MRNIFVTEIIIEVGYNHAIMQLADFGDENIRDKYRKNNKFNKILDLEKEELNEGPEMSAIIAKIAKVTRIFLAS